MNLAPSDQALGGGNRLQTGHAHAQDHHAGGLDGAGGGHQHREDALVLVGGDHDGLVARQVGLRGQHVHALRTGGARRGLQGESGQLAVGHGLQPVLVERVEHAHQHGTGLHQRAFIGVGRTHFQHHLGAQGTRRIGDLGTGGHIGFVGHAGGHAGSGLHTKRVALGLELLDGLRGHGHAAFAGSGLQGYANEHTHLLVGQLRDGLCLTQQHTQSSRRYRVFAELV